MVDVPFTIGESYHRVNDIHTIFGGNRYSGISPSADNPLVFLFYGESGEWHGYEDEFTEDGRLLYTGEGREGDMTMDDGNAAIREHKANDEELHVFESGEDAWEVTYVGEYEYSDHHWTKLPDRNENMRDAIRFELVPKGGLEIDTGGINPTSMDLEDLRELAVSAVDEEDETSTPTSSATRYKRSEIVKRFALRRADGICEGCGEEAPFIDDTGEPFLEVHHLHRRSDGGADHPANVAALCPNCHRRIHHGQDGIEYNQQIVESVN